MREKPTLILLHGGPGADHSGFKPAFSQFTDICQVIYLDQRGNGRSDWEPSEAWNLVQWGDDVYEFCRALEIEKPVVMGQSFGGFVAISYATRHPEHAGKLIFSSTAAQGRAHLERSIELFEKFGGPEVGELVRREFLDGFSTKRAGDWVRKAVPLYNRRPPTKGSEMLPAATVVNIDVLAHFHRAGGERMTFDMLSDLARIQCPTLVLGGEEDPLTVIEYQEDVAAAIPQHLVRFERFPNAGHGAYRDDPDAVFPIIREFILS